MKKMRAAPKKRKIMPGGSTTASFPIVGIGASAGGLEAYQELLKNLSAKPGMAIVFIMHLALMSRRNLFIYFQPVLQKKVFHNFHYGLRPGGG